VEVVESHFDQLYCRGQSAVSIMLVDWDLAHGENDSPKYSFITPTNGFLIHKNMFLHCSNAIDAIFRDFYTKT
jgi:hypothetical protein